MPKPCLTIPEQLEYLGAHKSVIVSDVQASEFFLFDNNYHNVVSAGKVRFINGYADGHYVYQRSGFEQWQEYYTTDVEVSKYLRDSILDFEKTLNSRVAQVISELVESGQLSEQQSAQVSRIINDAKVEGLEEFRGYETWRYVTRMTFGSTKRLLLWLCRNKTSGVLVKKAFGKVLGQTRLNGEYKRLKLQLDELNNLRNNVAHFTPVNVYLTSGRSSRGRVRDQYRKKAIKFVLSRYPNPRISQTVQQIFLNTSSFVAIKNSRLESRLSKS